MDVLAYTRSELEKELVLLEKHLKQYPFMKGEFCMDCSLKHLSAIEGLAEEGVGFGKGSEEKAFFGKVAGWAKGWRHGLPRSDEEAEKAAEEARTMRKDVILSPLLRVRVPSVEGGYERERESNPRTKKDLWEEFGLTKEEWDRLPERERKRKFYAAQVAEASEMTPKEVEEGMKKLIEESLRAIEERKRERPEGSNPGPIEKPISLLGLLKGEKSMAPMSGLDAASILVSGFAGKLADRGLIEIDRYYGKELLPVSERYRTYLAPALGVGLTAGSFLGLKRWAATPERGAIQLGVFNVGSTLLDDLVEIGEELIMTAGAAGLQVTPAGGVPARGAVAARGSYVVTR